MYRFNACSALSWLSAPQLAVTARHERPPPRIAPYPRLNAVAIYADEPTREEIKQMIVGLDVQAPK